MKWISVFFLALFAFPKALFSQSPVSTSNKQFSIQFKLDASVANDGKPFAHMGIRGNTPPLSWERSFPLSDPDGDGIYEATVNFNPVQNSIEYKYHFDSTWEDGSNRIVAVSPTKQVTVNDTWRKPNTAQQPAYPDSIGMAELKRTIIQKDEELFGAYNSCNIAVMDSLFSEDIEFYHDRGGLSRSKKDILESTRRNICGKVQRELLPGSIEVSPIPGFGAVQMGKHRFHNLVEKSRSGYSKFVTVWRLEGGKWKVTRVISLHE